MKTQSCTFLESCGEARSPIAILGLPFDGTCSYKPGCRFGPQSIRDASWGLEEYCPELDAELDGEKIEDLGDLRLPISGASRVVDQIYETASELLANNKRLMCFGGEHLVTYPLVKAYAEKYPEITLLHFDAHADLRDNYLGERLSHAAAISLCLSVIDPDSLKQFGIRSGTRDEFDLIRKHETLHPVNAEGAAKALSGSTGPLYITVDIDVFDPGLAPGTGTPEPGGVSYSDFSSCLRGIAAAGRPIVGCDVVEVSPPCDPAGITAVLGAKIARRLLMLMGAVK